MCKRSRPKYKIGDILEEYVIKGYSAPKGTIYHYMVMDIEYREIIKFSSKRILYNKKNRQVKTKLGWIYTLKSFRTGQLITSNRHAIDVKACIKKIG